MLNLKTMLGIAAIGVGIAQPAVAQDTDKKVETRHYPSWFMGIQGGAQAVMNGYDFCDVVTPIGALQIGAYVSPSLGARVHMNGWKAREGVEGFGSYRFDYLATNVDMMINLTNAFSNRDDHMFNVILLGGIGINKAWRENYKELEGYAYEGQPGSAIEVTSEPSNHLAFSERVGVMFDFRFSKHWSANLEVQANHVEGRSYAHEFNGAKDWQLAGFLGVTYTFGHKKQQPKKVVCPPAPQPKPAPQPVPEPQPEPKPAPQPAPAPVKVLAEQTTYLHFGLGKKVLVGAELAKVEEVAAWLKSHPSATATIKGYADKGTGSASINVRYARDRAAYVVHLLTDKYGIAADRLTSSSYGDTVQPFAENDRNRVVVVFSKEK